jgi:hypothetical protein
LGDIDMTDLPRFVHRTLKLESSDYEKKLASTLLGILGRGVHDLTGIVEALNQAETRPEAAPKWTSALFVSEMERLGYYPNSQGAALGSHIAGAEPPGANTSERVSHQRVAGAANGR